MSNFIKQYSESIHIKNLSQPGPVLRGRGGGSWSTEHGDQLLAAVLDFGENQI